MPEKKFENKNKKNIFCRVSELALDKGTSLPSARPDTRQRQHVCRVLMASTRQRMTEGPPPASPEVFCRGLFFAECLTLGKEDVCRGPSLPSVWHSAKAAFAECWICRVRHSANCLFAECPCFDTRHSVEHSAKYAISFINYEALQHRKSC